jgi:hypothetical protein
MRGNMTYSVVLSTDAFGNITRINNALDGLGKHLERHQSELENLNTQRLAAKEELARPFTQEQELLGKESRLVLLNADLNIDGDGGMEVLNDGDSRDDADEREQSDYESDDEPDGGVQPEYGRGDARGQRVGFGYGREEMQRTGTYGKAAPSFVDNILSKGDKKRAAPQQSGKSNERDI